MSWYRFRPVERWPVTPTLSHNRRSRSTFKARWSDTLDLLRNELAFLEASNVVLQCYAKNGEADIRVDGQLRANANVVKPGVIVSFNSMHGPLSYPCDSCDYWQHNVRSIALALKALRAVDRYGVAGRSEQYRGWAKIAVPSELIEFETITAAWEFIDDLLADRRPGLSANEAIRTALVMAHPDGGGTTKRFKLVQAAKEKILGSGK